MIERLGQPFFLPSIVFGFAYLTAPYQQHLPESIRTIFQDPIWALALVTILDGVFNRGKTLLTILLLSITMFYSDGVSSGSIFDHPLFEFGVAAIIPMNLAIIILLRERGVLTRSGCLRLIIISAQFIAIYQLSLTVPTLQLDWLSYPVISSSESWPQFLPVSQVGFLTSLGALLVVTTATIARPTPITNSMYPVSTMWTN